MRITYMDNVGGLTDYGTHWGSDRRECLQYRDLQRPLDDRTGRLDT